MESFEYEPAWALGANCGNADAATIAKVIDQCNDYSLDAIEMGNVLSMYMEASEKGYTHGDGGLNWGDQVGMVETARKIAFREGIGDVLAQGTERAAKHFGHPEIAMTVKGLSSRLRPARHQRHGHRLCHQQPRRLPPARLHPAAEVIGNVLVPLP